MENEEKVLTRVLVEELGLDKLEVITSDMIEGYTSIGYHAFCGCTLLTSITLPNSITEIGRCAFKDCFNLTSITLPNSITEIGRCAFNGCSSLTSITLPNSITSIGSNAFFCCTSITSINIPNSIINIGVGAFYNVPNIVYSGTVKGSPWGAISVNGYVEGYLVYEDETKTTLLACSTAAKGKIIIPNSVTSIGDGAFDGCTSLTSITIGNSVTSIGSYAFFGCTSLTSIKLPNTVTSIEYSAFDKCSSITSITIPNSIKCIEKYAFYHCNKLKNVVIGDKVYKKHKVIKNKCKAYKAFNADLTCRDFQYEEGKTYEIDGEPELCYRGFHACLKLLDVFDYYYSEIGKDIVIHEVELEGVSDEMNERDSKVVAKKITIGKRIL